MKIKTYITAILLIFATIATAQQDSVTISKKQFTKCELCLDYVRTLDFNQCDSVITASQNEIKAYQNRITELEQQAQILTEINQNQPTITDFKKILNESEGLKEDLRIEQKAHTETKERLKKFKRITAGLTTIIASFTVLIILT